MDYHCKLTCALHSDQLIHTSSIGNRLVDTHRITNDCCHSLRYKSIDVKTATGSYCVAYDGQLLLQHHSSAEEFELSGLPRPRSRICSMKTQVSMQRLDKLVDRTLVVGQFTASSLPTGHRYWSTGRNPTPESTAPTKHTNKIYLEEHVDVSRQSGTEFRRRNPAESGSLVCEWPSLFSSIVPRLPDWGLNRPSLSHSSQPSPHKISRQTKEHPPSPLWFGYEHALSLSCF